MPVLRYNSTGIWVELLQSKLKMLGYYFGPIDAIFGKQTRDSVYWFQSEYGLIPDGVVGAKTWEKLMPYINRNCGEYCPNRYEISIQNSYDEFRRYSK